MAISMENYNINCDPGQHKAKWQSVWRITISVDTGQDKMNGNSCAESVVKLDKIKLNGNKYGEICQYQL